MAAQYPYTIDGSTREGQDEVLTLWSKAELNISSAVLIMRVTHDEFLALAKERDVTPPSEEALAARYAELDARLRPHVRGSERDRARKLLSTAFEQAREARERLEFVLKEATAASLNDAAVFYAAALNEIDNSAQALAIAMTHIDDAKRAETAGGGYDASSIRFLEKMDPPRKRPDYYLASFGEITFDHVHPVTVQDILWSWSQGFLTTAAAAEEMLKLDESQSLEALARAQGIPEPAEDVITPEEAAVILGDDPVDGDLTFRVRSRIRDARLASYRRSDVEARKLFEDRQNGLLRQIYEELDDDGK
jgi:hypothetical protein